MEPRKAAAVAILLTSHQPRLGKSDMRAPQTQLQFSRKAPALPEKLPVRYTSPRPIIVEKLAQLEGWRDQGAGDALDPQGSVDFSVVSEEELSRAVQLARRDVKRRHLEEQVRQHLLRREAGPPGRPRDKESRQTAGPRGSGALLSAKPRLGSCSQMETTGSGAKVFLYTPTRVKLDPSVSDSPPTRDPGPGAPAPVLKKEEEDKGSLEVRRLQRELQRYIQKIEELARKERSEKMLDPDEERRIRVRRQEQAVRSARMLYVLQQQVKEIQEDLEKLSPHKIRHTKKSRAMARLAAAHRGAIRALQTFVAHCADQPEQRPAPAHCKELGNLIRQLSLCSARLEMDSCVPDVVIDLLLQIEDLDRLLAQKASPKRGPEWLPASQADPPKGPTRLPRREKKAGALEPRKPPVARRLLPDPHPPEPAEILARQRSSACSSPQRHTKRSPRNRDPSLGRETMGEGKPGAPKKVFRANGTPTHRAEKVERTVRERLEPILAKAQKVNLSLERNTSPKEPLRDGPRLPQDAGKAAAAVAAGGLEWGEKAGHEALPALSTSDLETMLRRMEEIERSQGAMRRRYTQVVYSDPEFWAQEERRGRASAVGGPEPAAPHPIQITRLDSHKEPQVDVVLERPWDASAVEEEEVEAADGPRRGTRCPLVWRIAPRKEAGIFLSVPKDVLQSISDYGARYEQHLKCISHEAVGSFNPWHIAESLAEQLAEEAVADVAAELQGLCEDYAEAVFTAEFLQAAE